MTQWGFFMKLYTIRVQSWRRAKNLDIPFIDTTVKTGNKAFAPTWPLLSKYKSKLIDADAYTERFYELMRISYRNNPEEWDEIMSHETLAIGCYCPSGEFCHRYLLKDIFQKVAESRGIEFEYLGEL